MLKTKPIKNFQGYSISKSGIVISPKGKRLNHNWRGWPGFYLYVNLYKNKKNYKKQVHRLVAETWIKNSNPKKLKYVNHKSGNRSNVCSYNLEWTDHQTNCLHRSTLKGKKKF